MLRSSWSRCHIESAIATAISTSERGEAGPADVGAHDGGPEERPDLGRRVVVERGERAVVRDATVDEHEHPVGEPAHLGEIVA